MHEFRPGRITAFFTAVCLFLSVLAGEAWAQGGAQTVESNIIRLDLVPGRSYPITTPTPISRVSVANPEVADVVVLGDRELVINGKTSGETDVIVVGNDQLRRHYRVQVRSATDRRQIALSVRFAEVRKDFLRQLGVNALYRDKAGNVRAGTGIFRTDNVFRDNGSINVGSEAVRFGTVLTDFGSEELLALIDAEQQRGNARSLAEPTIIAANREDASFLAGGEIPIPVIQSGGGGASQVVIIFREFGVRLFFNAEILNDSLMKLKVRPEVSSLDFANAVLFSGFRIPALRTRRTQTTLDMRPNSSLIVSGLFSNEREMVRTGIPGLMDIPLIGVLFGSTRWQNNETELVVIVTPTVLDSRNPRTSDVVPVRPDTALPAREVLEPRLRSGAPPRRP